MSVARKKGIFGPDSKLVRDHVRIFQPSVRDFLVNQFAASFPTSGMTNYGMEASLKNLIPHALLATSPREGNIAQHMKSALDAVGYYGEFAKAREYLQPDSVEKLGRLIEQAKASFPFDLTQIAFDGNRPGYADEWIVGAKTKGEDLQNREVRSIALCFLFDKSLLLLPFGRLVGEVVTGKTVATDLSLPEKSDIEFKTRVVRRSFQEFPREFASS